MARVSEPRTPPCPPLRFDATPSSLVSNAQRLVDTTSALVDRLFKRKNGGYTFANAIFPFIEAENLRLREARVIQFYSSTSPHPGLREASRKATKILSDATVDLFSRTDFYKVVSAVREMGDNLDPEYEYYLEKLADQFDQNGLSISEKEKSVRFVTVTKKISSLSIEALRILDNDVNGIWLTHDELHGLPPNFLENRRKTTDHSITETNLQEEKFWITGKEPDTLPVFKFSTNAETRKRVFLMTQHRCAGNIPLYQEILQLRDEAARLLGFANHATFMSYYKTVKTPDVVDKFLSDLEGGLRQQRDDEINVLLKLKQEDLSADGNNSRQHARHLFLWDRAYYDRIRKEKECAYDHELVMEYFSLEHCMLEMFETFEHLFGIRIQSFDASVEEVWHDTVSLYTVWDSDDNDAFLGWLYIDPYPRDGKYAHFGHYGLQQGCWASTGEKLYPAAALVVNFPPPSASKPTLLIHDQLRRLFHELGHAMHNLLCETKCARFHGANDRDFAEAVGMMFENFLWTPKHMMDISTHYSYLSPTYLEAWQATHPGVPQPPRHMPEDLIERLASTKYIGGTLVELTKLWQSKFDMAIHSPKIHEDIKNLDLQLLFNKSRAEIMGLAGPEVEDGSFDWGHGFSSFRAVVNGYHAGYYTYLLSQIWSYDLFHSGFRGDTMNPEKGRRFRNTVLQPGGSKPGLDILREFLGRDPNDDAFRQEHGL